MLCSILDNLMIETGRYKRPKILRNDRYCPLVLSNPKYVHYCNKYTSIRTTYINKHVISIKFNHPNRNDIATIMIIFTKPRQYFVGE